MWVVFVGDEGCDYNLVDGCRNSILFFRWIGRLAMMMIERDIKLAASALNWGFAKRLGLLTCDAKKV